MPKLIDKRFGLSGMPFVDKALSNVPGLLVLCGHIWADCFEFCPAMKCLVQIQHWWSTHGATTTLWTEIKSEFWSSNPASTIGLQWNQFTLGHTLTCTLNRNDGTLSPASIAHVIHAVSVCMTVGRFCTCHPPNDQTLVTVWNCQQLSLHSSG